MNKIYALATLNWIILSHSEKQNNRLVLNNLLKNVKYL